MARKRKRSKKSQSKWTIDKRWRAISALFIAMMSIFLLIALTSYIYTWKEDQDKVIRLSWDLLLAQDVKVQNWLGRFGAIISFLTFYKGIGVTSFLLPVFGFGCAIIVYFKRHWMQFIRLATYLSIAILIFPLTFEFLLHASPFAWGGAFGYALFQYFSAFIGMMGLGVMLLFAFIGLIYWHNEYLPQIKSTFQFRWTSLRRRRKQFVDTFLSGEALQNGEKVNPVRETAVQPSKSEYPDEPPMEEEKQEPVKELEEAIELDTSEISKRRDQATQEETDTPGIQLEMDEKSFGPAYEADHPEPEVREATMSDDDKLVVEREDKTTLLEPFDPTKELSRYTNPVLDLLDNYMIGQVHINRTELESNKDQIITTLQNYKIEITKIRATVGPTVTLYEIIPAPGVRISKIKNLEDDIALSLAALGIRIIAPIPGKGTIGIEVPNKKKQIVSLKETIASEKFTDAKMELPIGLGKTISNEVFVADLAKMPHLLIAGATGQGKSVGINTIIMSLLYRKHPSQVKLILIDPKKVELFPYSKLEKHFLAFLPGQDEPIITDTKKVVHTLNSLCIEMDERYNLLKKAYSRNIKEYNKKFIARKLNPLNGHKYMPFIVLVIDEFADLIMTAGKEVEMPIARLAQLARAVGIHLIIATQRPSVNIITGVIKANFPARIAFKVTSKVDSRTILDAGGADQLIGRGDMLLSVGSDLVRLQCAFIDTPEVERVIDYISDQAGFGEPYYLPEYNDPDEDGGDPLGDIKVSDLDELFTDAGRLVVMERSGSTSMLQRKLKLGYNRAGRIMDQLEHFGVVGPSEGSKAREVYFDTESELLQHLEMVIKDG
ncbi:DNA translocase FtsK [Membranicola marinus]|uniref:DNA translocase FtsK n=1 Tax=Membranihabitans marinus TaxID=1227546 RepID=A0A953HWD5_9BACT|nr:DNA translocase FtsK [Membranihabitans marinus]MBY5959720.1 DNA translocase FtsK [Membranihabitans marinus]